MDIIEIIQWAMLVMVIGILAVIPLRLVQYLWRRLAVPLRWR